MRGALPESSGAAAWGHERSLISVAAGQPWLVALVPSIGRSGNAAPLALVALQRIDDRMLADIARAAGTQRIDLAPAAAASEGYGAVRLEATPSYLVERYAAVKEVLGEPPPRPFPQPAWIDRKRIECDHERTEAAERRLGLGVELLRERKISTESPTRERFTEQLSSFRRGERDRVIRERAAEIIRNKKPAMSRNAACRRPRSPTW